MGSVLLIKGLGLSANSEVRLANPVGLTGRSIWLPDANCGLSDGIRLPDTRIWLTYPNGRLAYMRVRLANSDGRLTNPDGGLANSDRRLANPYRGLSDSIGLADAEVRLANARSRLADGYVRCPHCVRCLARRRGLANDPKTSPVAVSSRPMSSTVAISSCASRSKMNLGVGWLSRMSGFLAQGRPGPVFPGLPLPIMPEDARLTDKHRRFRAGSIRPTTNAP
jgi:hypothetical protein